MNDFLKMLDLATDQGSLVLSAVAVTREINELKRLRAIRHGLSTLLSRNIDGTRMPADDLQYEIQHRVDAIGATFVVDARIAEICAPDIHDAGEFVQLVVDLCEEADIADGRGIILPDLEKILEARGS